MKAKEGLKIRYNTICSCLKNCQKHPRAPQKEELTISTIFYLVYLKYIKKFNTVQKMFVLSRSS